jgi:hypothetical protein
MCQVNGYKASNRYNTVWILLITVRTNRSIKTTATGPVYDIAQWKKNYFYLTQQLHRDNKNKKISTTG